MHKAFSTVVSLLMAVAAAGLSGCGGGHAQTSDAIMAVCTPSPAGIHQSVDCSLEGADLESLQDCTFFIEKPGARIPVDAEVSESEESDVFVSFRVPVLIEREANLLVGCGDDFQNLTRLRIGEAASKAEEEDTIAPSNREAPVPTSVEKAKDTEIADTTTEEIIPIVPSTPASPSEDVTATVPTPPPFEVSLEGSLVPNPATPGAARLSGVVRGGGALREAYLYGPFAPDGNCERLLAIDPSGGALNAGSRNHETYRSFTGIRCDATLDNCEGLSPSTAGPVICRVDLKRDRDAFDFYFRLSQPSTQTVLVVQSEDGTLKTDRATIGAATLAAGLGTVKITLSEDAPEFSVSFLYSQAQGSPSVEGCTSTTPAPTASGISGTYKREHCALPESGTIDVAALVPGILGGVKRETYRIACGAPQADLKKMSFTKADGLTCTVSESNWTHSCDATGELELQGEAWKTCEIQKRRDDGSFETISSYTVPWVTMKLTEVSAAGGSCATTNDAWIPADPATVRNGRAILNRRLKRNHDCYNYAFSVQNGSTTLTEAAPFEASFDLLSDTSYQYCRGVSEAERAVGTSLIAPPRGLESAVANGSVVPQNYKSSYNQCPGNAGTWPNEFYWFETWVDKSAYDSGDFFKVSWQGHHLKSIRSSCTAGGPGTNLVAVSRVRRHDRNWNAINFPTVIKNPTEKTLEAASSYGFQTDVFKLQDDVMGAKVTCRITAVTYDNQEITRTQEWDACSSNFPTCLAR